VDHHIITVVSDHEVRLQQLEGGTSLMDGDLFVVRSLTPSTLVVSRERYTPLVYTYTVVHGRLTDVKGSLGPHTGLCAQSPCPVLLYS
jgi:hypothetical protein